MLINYSTQLSYILRIVIAAICGLAIGYERKNRMKEAGIRTHFIVAVGAALMMIVSKYGFQDQIGWANLSLDPSRISAQIVSGVGFIGAGLIFMESQTVRGLTTAAGVWATAGIGMAIGSGLYSIGLATTLIIILGQILLHGNFKWLTSPKTELLTLQVENKQGIVQDIQKILEKQDITILSFKAKQNKQFNELTDLNISIKVYESFNITKLLSLLNDNPFVKSAEF